MILFLFVLALEVSIVILFHTLNGNPWLLFLWIPLAILIGFILTVVFILFGAIPFVGATKPQNKLRQLLISLCGHYLLLMMNSHVKVYGRKNMVKSNCLIVSNHKSLIDPVFIYAGLRRVGWPCAKKEVPEEMPYLKFILDNFHTMYIDRENDRNSLKEIIKGINELKAGNDVLIFPEGGIKTRDVEQMVAIKSGSYKLAVKANVPIQPIALVGNTKTFTRKCFFKHVRVKLYILEPLMPEQYANMTTHEIGVEILNRVNKMFGHEEKHEVAIDE